MATRDFEIAPAGAFARAFPLLVGGTILVATLVPLAVLGTQDRFPAAAWIAALAAVAVAVPVIAWLHHGIRHPRLRLVDGVLHAGRLPRLRTPAAHFALDAVRIVDLDRVGDRALQPRLRAFGTSLPGYHAGWFWMRDGSTAYLLVTARDKVLVLPRRDGNPLIVSAVRPEQLLDALRQASR